MYISCICILVLYLCCKYVVLSRIIHLLYKELQNILCEFILNKIDYIRNKRVGIEEYREKIRL